MKSAKPEIMSPAGDFVCMDAALRAGADAVYFGIRGSNMRAGAGNFSISDIPRAVKMCSRFGAKAYLTLNTVYFDNEIAMLRRVLKRAAQSGIDAVIAWDFSAISAAREFGLPVFLSTQASVSNSEAIAQYNLNFGINRFVLARECTLQNLKSVRSGLRRILGASKAGKIEIEVFAHGAMCVSVSGRCFMSQFQSGKSANRGECMQPCRRMYRVFPKMLPGDSSFRADSGEFCVGDGFVLSPKDLCTIPFIEKLIQAGVNSLKIEGRNRNAQYVDVVTSAYRRAVDYYFQNRKKSGFEADFSALKKDLLQELSTVFTRGFSDGFYMGKPSGDWTSEGNVSTKKKTVVGRVKNYFSKIGVAEISVECKSLRPGDEICFEGNTTGYFLCKIETMHGQSGEIEQARRGDVVGVRVPRRVRPSDRVYALV